MRRECAERPVRENRDTHIKEYRARARIREVRGRKGSGKVTGGSTKADTLLRARWNGTMRALVIGNTGRLAVTDVPEPEREEECRIRVNMAGICGTDLQLLDIELLAAGAVKVKPLISRVASL